MGNVKKYNQFLNEEFKLNDVKNFMSKKNYSKYIEDKLEGKTDDEKLEFLEKIINTTDKNVIKNWKYAILPIVISFFALPKIVPAMALILVYQTISFMLRTSLDVYKEKLNDIKNKIEEELEKSNETYSEEEDFGFFNDEFMKKYENDLQKVINTISSCNIEQQLNTCSKMIDNFQQKYNMSEIYYDNVMSTKVSSDMDMLHQLLNDKREELNT